MGSSTVELRIAAGLHVKAILSITANRLDLYGTAFGTGFETPEIWSIYWNSPRTEERE